MAREVNQATVVILTATNPDDTTLVAAPGAGRSIRLRWVHIGCTTAVAATSVTLEDGVGGDQLCSASTAVVGGTMIRFAGTDKQGRSHATLSANTLLNATSLGDTGAVAYARVCYEII